MRVPYQLKPSDGRRLNSSIKEHQSMLGKLKSVVKALKEHDSTRFQSNGLILKQGEEFAHDFSVKLIKCVEAKVQKVTRDTETLEESKDSFRRKGPLYGYQMLSSDPKLLRNQSLADYTEEMFFLTEDK